MDKANYIQLLKNTSFIQREHTSELKTVIEKFPYFQSARALYLKALKNQNSFKYNNELKITASYSTDRTILFDFITSKTFNDESQPTTESRETEKKVNELEKKDEIETKKDKKIIEAEKDLQLGKPLNFSKSEAHSFNQWLQLSSKTQVLRLPTLDEETSTNTKEQTVDDSQKSIIDQFIANNPKISRINKNAKVEAKVTSIEQPNELMTETLAKVYLEQKKYENAIQAYKILSLKYPEKSGFFADQIKSIQTLQKQ